MKLSDDQKELIKNYLKQKVVFEILSLELIHKTIFELYNLLKIPGLQISYLPYFGPNENQSSTVRADSFSLVLAIHNEVGILEKMYTVSIHPITELEIVKIKG